MLTKISAATAFIAAAINVAVLMGWDLSVDQVAGINAAVVAAGVLVHSFFNPAIPIGVTEPK
jgi:hypothetical protein